MEGRPQRYPSKRTDGHQMAPLYNSNSGAGSPLPPARQAYLANGRPAAKAPTLAPITDLAWSNGYHATVGQPFQVGAPMQPAVLQDFTHLNNNIPPRALEPTGQFRGFAPGQAMPDSYALPTLMAPSVVCSTTNDYPGGQKIIPRQPQLRQLPSMTTVISGSNTSNKFQPSQPQHYQEFANNVGLSLEPSSGSYNRRSLPPMAQFGANFEHERRSLNNEPIYPATTNRRTETQLRKLPIITPNGPRPLSQRHPSQALNDNLTFPTQKHPPIVNDSRFLHTTNLKYAADSKNIQPDAIRATSRRHNSENSNPSEFRPSSWDQQSYMASKKRLGVEAPHDRPQRQLPIITRQGVLKLRDKASNMSSGESGRARQLRSKGHPAKRYGDNEAAAETSTAIRREANKAFLNLKNVSSENEPDCIEDYSPVQDDMDIDEDQMTDENPYESEIDDGEITSSGSNLELRQSFEQEDGSEGYADIGHNQQVDPYSNNLLEKDEQGDLEEEEEEEFYVDPSRPNELEEEAEFFSALATVPEEEGKLSDKDIIHDFNRASDSETYRSEETKSNDNDGKPPVITENGFEAQVLEYIAEKAGLRRGELFSVDEEPSSYNDESRASEVESQADQVQRPADGLGAPEEDKNLQYSTMSNEETFRLKGKINLQNDYVDQQSQLKESVNQAMRNNLQNYPMVYDEADMEQMREEEPNIQIYTQNSEMIGQKISIETGENEFNQELKSNLQDIVGSGATNATEYMEGEQLEPEHDHMHQQQDSRVPEMTISADSGEQMIDRFYELDRLQTNNYQSNEKEEEEDGRGILISTANNKSSLEQEEYDEQYRDINNLDDLDRRATNHVHAIDGHSKSMLNDIHQQRTIVDYYDDDGEFNNYEQNGSNMKEEISNYEADDQQTRENDTDRKVAEGSYYFDEAKDKMPRSEDGDDKDDEYEQPRDEYNSRLPRARWIAAVNKIVNHIGEVSNL